MVLAGGGDQFGRQVLTASGPIGSAGSVEAPEIESK
jgi:hypothetical protein